MMRPGETQGGEYHFVSRDHFRSLILEGQLNDWDYIFDEYYGAYLSDVQDAVMSNDHVFIHALAKIAVRTALRFPNRVLTVMLLPSPESSLTESRLRLRKAGDAEVQARLRHTEDEVAQLPLVSLGIRNADVKSSEDILEEVLFHANRWSQ